jgi:dTDP-4-amino-4,6-dideoxygalactose transaminase
VPAHAAQGDRCERVFRSRNARPLRTQLAFSLCLQETDGLCVVKPTNADARLALDGGEPVRAKFLPYCSPLIGEEEIAEIVETLRSGWIGTGPRVARFEQEFAAFVGSEHAVAVSSGTAALFLSLVALGIGGGDEVITTPFTFAATVNVIEHVGATPVLVDIDPDTFNIDPGGVERALTRRTRAIIPVHFGGLPCDMSAIRIVAERSGVAIVEDAAHALGARCGEGRIGSIGTLTAFSFDPVKNLTTGEGGMITTSSAPLAHELRRLRLHGLSRDAWTRFQTEKPTRADIISPGYKYNMPDIMAALGIHQLRRQESLSRIREGLACYYDRAIENLAMRPQPRPPESHQIRHALHLYLVVLEERRWSVHRDRVLEALRAENIGATVHYTPIHEHPYYREKYTYEPDAFPCAHAIGERVLTLPLSPGMSTQDVEDVLNALRKVTAAYAV